MYIEYDCEENVIKYSIKVLRPRQQKAGKAIILTMKRWKNITNKQMD